MQVSRAFDVLASETRSTLGNFRGDFVSSYIKSKDGLMRYYVNVNEILSEMLMVYCR